MGRKHGAAAVAWHPKSGAVEWMGQPGEFRLSGRLTLQRFLHQAGGGGNLAVLRSARCVIGIDAPLGYPRAFRRLVYGEAVLPEYPAREIDNAFAYRETERHVHKVRHKKPLSAPFDKLGNNASVALSHARRWSRESGIKIVPFEEVAPGENVIIEVYPALEKTREGDLRGALRELMPDEVEPKTDAYDAAICSLIALAYAAEGRIDGLPKVCGPEVRSEVIQEEGWIYYLDGCDLQVTHA